ncbi:MAG: glycosyltransferase family 2 protein [Anaerolineales bacterium]|nr:glycosyltransferase family 2 protein [Anaerolineales bacterium]
MTFQQATAVSVIICTRNRGDQIIAAVRSVLASAYSQFEFLIIDQSTNNKTAKAIAPFAHDTRLRLVPSETIGKGNALNLGLSLAQGNIIALTDDDCIVPSDWLGQIVDLFTENPQLGLAYTSVAAAPFDANKGFIPAHEYEKSRLVTAVSQNPWGMGAACAVRKQMVHKLGGIDAMLGPGSPFFSAEDTDLMLRALLHGYQIYELSETAVVHEGFRTWEQGRLLMQRDWSALGAVYAKLVRHNARTILPFIWHEVSLKLLLPPVRDLLKERQLRGYVPLRSFLEGFRRGWQTPVNPETLRFAIEHNSSG